jgi:beta-barrel assembly-enhancing protease
MTVQRLGIAFALIVAGSFCEASPQGPSSNQYKPSKSDSDIKAIGHRHIGKGVDFYSPQREKELGKQLAKQFERSAKLVDDPAITAYVDHVGQIIVRSSDARMPVVFRVIDADSPKAFTLPGGYQYVNRGLLLSVESEAELAGVLAHGIAHTALRSGTKEATQGDIAQLAMIPAMIFVPDGWPTTAVPSPAGKNLMIPLTALKSRREDELAADYFGLEYVYVTGYDPERYVNLVERIWPQVSSSIPPTFSTSPPLAERLAAMRKEIASILPKRNNAVVSTPEFSQFQERVRAWKPTNDGERQKPNLKKPTMPH